MKHINLFFNLAAVSACVVSLSACSNDNDSEPKGGNDPDHKEQMLKAAMVPYINNTVIPTYKGMADNAILMAEACNDIMEAYNEGNLSSDLVAKAGQYWNLSRDYWEKSEAFLYGAAADYNIDPHIDSWPLDKNQMDILLGQLRAGNVLNVENLGYGLLGFHAVEYMLYELSEDGETSLTHNLNYSPEELEYLCGVAEDLRNQCILLEASWAGLENVTAEKQELLDDAELEPGYNYGWAMINAGQAGSIYKNYQDAAQELIQGCIDIADEVGNTKIGRPHIGSSESDRNYIESPYSLNSITDFVGNIQSIKNAYFGSKPADASVSDFIKSVNPDLDQRLGAAIDDAIDAINAIPEPFAKSANGAVAGNAVTVVGTDLVDVLEEVMTELSK